MTGVFAGMFVVFFALRKVQRDGGDDLRAVGKPGYY